jgi:protease II
MDGDHGGPSGRFHRHRETTLGFAFLLDLMDIQQ